MKNKLFAGILCLFLLISCGESDKRINKNDVKQELKESIVEENEVISDNEKKINEILKRSQDFSENYGGNISTPKDISDGKLQEVKDIKKENYAEKVEETIENIENTQTGSILDDKKQEIQQGNEQIIKENENKTEVKQEEQKYRLKPFKDDLFSYHQTLEEKLDGNWRLLEFSMKVDVEDRDEIDVDKVFEHYIDRKTEKYREIKGLYGVEGFNYYEVTDRNQDDSEKKLITIYFHGKGGNKTWGINDETFGGNFNRIQNLMIENSGVYITTDTILGDQGIKDHTKLLEHLKTKYKNAKIVLIGGSNGGLMLWDLVNNQNSNKFIDGIILAGTVLDDKNQVESTKFLVKNKIPVYIAHGNKDHIPFGPKETFLKTFLYMGGKGKVVIFNGGIHGTPIRMIDYKEALNWMLENFEQK